MGSGSVKTAQAMARVGMVFGLLKLEAHLGSNKYRRATYEASCYCGRRLIVDSSHLKVKVPSCGCATRNTISEARVSHGGCKRSGKEPLYKVWCGMRRRCNNPSHPDYKWYGGKGVRVCERWSSYANFREDMAEGYSKGMDIDRIDHDKNYELDNCRWLAHVENCRRAVTAAWDRKRMKERNGRG